MNKVEVIKTIANFAVTAGVSSVVTNLVNATTPGGLKLGPRVLVTIGGVAVAWVVSDLASKYICDQIDNVVVVKDAVVEIVDDLKDNV